jgi:hypothetical protein
MPTWNNPKTWLTAEIVTAADMNTYISDLLAFIQRFLADNLAVFNDTTSYHITATSPTQIGSFATGLTTINTVDSGGLDLDTVVLLYATLFNNSATPANIQWYNNTAGALPALLGPTLTLPANAYLTIVALDRPATGANTYHLRGSVASGAATVNRIVGFALEFTR